MKLNWGKSVVVAFALFMAFILYFVFKVQGNSKYDNELVVDEYYKNDAHYGDDMLKMQNTEQLTLKPTIESTSEGVKIVFSENFNPKGIAGKVSCYRPSAKKLDFTQLLNLSGGSMLIPINDLAGGRWDMTLEWTYDGKDYLLKKQIYID
jgi:hypothetical protein